MCCTTLYTCDECHKRKPACEVRAVYPPLPTDPFLLKRRRQYGPPKWCKACRSAGVAELVDGEPSFKHRAAR